MIVAIVRFPLPADMSAEQARASFEASASSYQGLPGLQRKYYVRAQDGSEGGGVYLWESRAAAEAVYDDAWKSSAHRAVRRRAADRISRVPGRGRSRADHRRMSAATTSPKKATLQSVGIACWRSSMRSPRRPS